ncbi:hypothetical protein GCM10007079_08710 [Nocardiopsis terrae]|nr:hypothetical protein GCM10007079_08710 [Nocardiopsis terrae]
MAVIGLACRFGPADSADQLWELVSRGGTGIRRHETEHLIRLGHDTETTRRPNFVPVGSVLDDADAFDARFFGYTPQHAEWLEPQHRILLESAWHALEDASVPPRRGGARTSVFASVGQSTHPPVRITDLDAAGMARFSSSDKDFAATRISHVLGCTGPSMTVQTACSSGLVATHLAIESLLGEECDLALAGAASLHFPQAGYLSAPGMILSPSGVCRPFDDNADGTVFGNGVGVVVLRRLSDALRDGDPIRAVIRGSAVNNDGAAKMDYHAPSDGGQEDVIREALAVSGAAPESVGYVETHGTGTHLGDPIEYAALDRVYGTAGNGAALGSVKGTIGHLNTAAGIAGLIKAVLALEHGEIPPQASFDDLNSRIRGTGALRVPRDRAPWAASGEPRRAAVSSFGVGGTNAHVVVEEAPSAAAPPGEAAPSGTVWVPLSARTGEALRALAASLADRVGADPGIRPADVAHTLWAGRSHLEVRALVRADGAGELAEKLRTIASGEGADTTPGATPEYLAWLDGGDVPRVPPAPGARRIRLPGYPFARQRWRRPGHDGPGSEDGSKLGPGDPIVADHRVDGRPLLPAAVQIDAALAALGEEGAPAVLTDVVLLRPVWITEPTRIVARIEDGDVRVCAPEPVSTARVVAADQVPPRPERLDIAGTRLSCPEPISPASLYRRFSEGRVDYGPTFRVLRELRRGQGGALARAALPEGGGPRGRAVSPALLDGALQSVLGCVWDEDLTGGTMLPFAIDRIALHGTPRDEVWIHVRPCAPARSGARVRRFDVTVADDDGTVLLTLAGLALRRVAAEYRSERVHLFQEAEEPYPDGAPVAGPIAVIGDAPSVGADRHWPEPVDADGAMRLGEEVGAAFPDGDPPVVVWPVAQGTVPGSAADSAIDRAVTTLAFLRALLRPWARRGCTVLVPYPAEDPSARIAAGGLAALGRSLALENPRFRLVAAAMEPGTGDADLHRAIAAGASDAPASRHLVVKAREPLRTPAFRPLEPTVDAGTPFVRGGRYWINGAGRLALGLADHLVDRYEASLVLSGRSPLDGDRARHVRLLAERAERVGGSVEYVRLDCTDRAAVRDVSLRLAGGGAPVAGIVHCAGAVRDSYVIRKESDQVREVVAGKLAGAEALDSATADWPLDFFAVYSSVSGALGSQGQADYAFANAAVDELVRHRERLRERGARRGRSLSVAWPYWADGGMGERGTTEEVLAEHGMEPLETSEGLAVLEELLGRPEPVTPLVIRGDRDSFTRALPALRGPAEVTPAAEPAAPAANRPHDTAPERPGEPGQDTSLAHALEPLLIGAVAEATGLHTDEITPEGPFDALGVDSLLAIRVVELLGEHFGRLPKTLLFECASVAELAVFLADEYPELSARLAGGSRDGQAEAADAAPETAPPAPDAADPRRSQGEAVAPSPALVPAQVTGPRETDVAVIGMAGRFPQADGLDEFWDHLVHGRDCVTEVPRDRWDADALYDTDRLRPDRTYTKWGGFIDGVEEFDAPLFNISPREAGIIDPQARLFLEACWAVMEDAGRTPDRLTEAQNPSRRRQVGVFAGVMYGEYQLHEAEERLRGNPILANSAYWSIANRVSYFFDFQGPSVAVDTACSSALTAIHTAVDALRAGRCEVAIAGGVNVLIHPNKYLMLARGGFAASDGRCRSFGAGGDGYVPGEGVGAFLLKPLTAALRDGDHIHGVIRGTAANHGGRTNGYTVPNPRAQADLVSDALADARIGPGGLDYVEAHGTGTSLGDPIEIRGLTSVFARGGVTGPHDVPIGSVKSNVGHLESAAGAAAFAKVLLQMRHGVLVPSLHSDPPNPEIDFDRVPFSVQKGVEPWRTRDGSERPLRAGISSFGAGGANVHVVVEAPPPRAEPDPADGPVTVLLSARTDEALASYARDLRAFLTAATDRGEAPRPADVALTMAVGRVDLACRAAVRAHDADSLLQGLVKIAEGGVRGSTDEEDGPVADWLRGERIDKEQACGAGAGARRVPLPHYPFERVRCWYDAQIAHLGDRDEDSGEDASVRSHLRDFGRRPGTGLTPEAAVTPPTRSRPAPVPAFSPTPSEEAPMPAKKKVQLRSVTRTAAAPPEPAPPEPEPVPEPAVPSAPAPAPDPVPASGTARPSNTARRKADDTVREVLGEVLFTDPEGIEPELAFTDMGVDSILGVEFTAGVNARLGTTIAATALYDHPTPAAFAHFAAESANGVRTASNADESRAGDPADPVRAEEPEADRVRRITDDLRALLAQILYSTPDALEPDASFVSLGLDSILGVEYVSLINEAYGLEEKAGVLYDHPGLEKLARHIAAARLGGADPTPTGTAAALPVPDVPATVETDVVAVLDAVRAERMSVDEALHLLRSQGGPGSAANLT